MTCGYYTKCYKLIKRFSTEIALPRKLKSAIIYFIRKTVDTEVHAANFLIFLEVRSQNQPTCLIGPWSENSLVNILLMEISNCIINH